jgi:protein-L-isoaspartate O-methyltransferase
MIVPVGGPNDAQVLVRLERRLGDEIVREYLWPVRFVPLICG